MSSQKTKKHTIYQKGYTVREIVI